MTHVDVIRQDAVTTSSASVSRLAARGVTNDVPEHNHAERHAEEPRHDIPH
jgi:hypothetical protein